MTTPGKPLQGKVLPPRAGGVIPGAEAFAALNNVIEGTREYLRLREEEQTKRAQIEAYKATETARIKAAENILRDYFHQVLAERARTFDELLTRLDHATEAGDGQAASETLRAIVAIAQTSPLADLGDLGKLRQALDDPTHVWEL